MELKVIELFAGVGGCRVGLNKIKEFDSNTQLAKEIGDWNFVYANQYEPITKSQHAYNCYIKRFGENSCSNEDITKVDKFKIPDHSLLMGGFPCQDYSVARLLSKEKGIEGKKGVLFWDIKDVLLAKNTPFVLLENVDRLLKSPASKRGRDFAIMLKTFCELGYNVQWRAINASDYGMPQKRKRVFIFAHRKNLKYSKSILDIVSDSIFSKVFPVTTFKDESIVDLNKYKDILDIMDNYKDGKFLDFGYLSNGIVVQYVVEVKKETNVTLNDIVLKALEYHGDDYNNYVLTDEQISKVKYLKGSKRIKRISKDGHEYFYSEGEMSFPDNIKLPSRTILTNEGSVSRTSHFVYDGYINKYRFLTERECELLQMFPIDWTNTMPKRKRYFVMGNALVTGIISRLEPELKNIIKNE